MAVIDVRVETEKDIELIEMFIGNRKAAEAMVYGRDTLNPLLRSIMLRIMKLEDITQDKTRPR